MTQKDLNQKDIKQHYNWYVEHCNRFKKEKISYAQYKKEFIEQKEESSKSEEQERLKLLSKSFNDAMRLLK